MHIEENRLVISPTDDEVDFIKKFFEYSLTNKLSEELITIGNLCSKFVVKPNVFQTFFSYGLIKMTRGIMDVKTFDILLSPTQDQRMSFYMNILNGNIPLSASAFITGTEVLGKVYQNIDNGLTSIIENDIVTILETH